MSSMTKSFSVVMVILATLAVTSPAHATTPCTPSSIGMPCATGVFAYDGSGNVRTIGNDVFTYDAFGRLATASLQSATGKGQAYSYDAVGNLNLITYTQDGVPNGVTPIDNDTYSSSNHLKSATYDDAGDVTAVAGMTFTYDASGMVTAASATSGYKLQIYTADDERIGTLEVSAPFANARVSLKPYKAAWRVRGTSSVLREMAESMPATGTSTWSWIRDWTYRDGNLLAESLPLGSNSESWRHYHLDHLGTPRLITDETGSKVSIHDYYPFGEEITSIAGQTEVTKFTGHERDFLGGTLTENKQYVDYMHARYSGSVIGRFLSADPVIGDPTVPQSWNRYAYGLNDPIGVTDPTGLKPCKIKVTGNNATLLGVADGSEVDGECVDEPPPEPSDNTMWAEVFTEASREANSARDLQHIRDTERNRPCPAQPVAPGSADVQKNMQEAEKHRPATFSEYQWFKAQVGPNRPWDYKRVNLDLYEAFGNFNYGATGAAMGIPDDVLLRAAGYYQPAKAQKADFGHWWGDEPFGDDPIDQVWIKRGIEHYRKGCK